MANPPIKASVVILTWNAVDLLRACLASLAQALTTYSYEVIVVDNGSRDCGPVSLRQSFPHMQLIINRFNRGVAPGRNQGMRVTSGEYIILLDDDTVAQPGAFDCLLTYMEDQSAVGLCAPKLVNADGQLQLTCRLFPTLGDKFARQLPLAFAQRMRRRAEMADWTHDTIREVDYVIGACQVIRRRALYEVGLLDEQIFYGPEDIDLCLRLHQAGWRVVYHPGAVVIHKERRIARSMLSQLGWRHGWGLGYFFWKHGYLFSRQKVYARLSDPYAHLQ